MKIEVRPSVSLRSPNIELSCRTHAAGDRVRSTLRGGPCSENRRIRRADCDKTVTLIRFPVLSAKLDLPSTRAPIWSSRVVTRDRYADGALILTLEVASGSVVRDS